MPLGNLTSQFFANIYLNELDQFVKHTLKTRYYIRYVDDFILLHSSKEKLKIWKEEIEFFLKEKLKLELHKDKSKILSLSRVVDFVGFRNFYHFKLPRKRNITKMKRKIIEFKDSKRSYGQLMSSFQGWNAYVKWGNSFKVQKEIIKEIHKIKSSKKAEPKINKYLR